MERKVTARQTSGQSKRQLTYCYVLSNKHGTHKVCKTFFLQTLVVKEDVVYGAWSQVKSSGVVEHDRRGKHNNHKKLTHI